MEIHASCAARHAAGVLLLGPSGSGKSDLLLRLLDQGFMLVADDRVVIEAGFARARRGGEGLLEVRGIGIVRLPFLAEVRLRLAVRLGGGAGERLPMPNPLPGLGIPVIDYDAAWPSSAARVRVALDCVTGQIEQVSGFAVE